MTKKLEEEFNLPPIEEALADEDEKPVSVTEAKQEIEVINHGLSVAEKINDAFREIRGLEAHESEMDDVALKAIDSYEQLMNLGMNVSDMAAGKVFAEASNMLKIALEAKDSKTKAKLQQLDLMLKKARLDKMKNQNGDDDSDVKSSQVYDRNELLRIMKGDS
jgi:fructose-1,6-bisphosphatase/inositol monophosphatase family enzyme